MSVSLLIHKKYQHIIPIGEACFVTTLLKNAGKREYSFPFDWLMGGNLKTRLDLILGNFENFFNEEDFALLDTNVVDDKCDIYINNKNSLIFNHDFAKNIPFHEAYIDAKEKYQRRITRLYDYLINKENVLLLYMDSVNSHQTISNDELTEYLVKLNLQFKMKDVHLLYYKNVAKPDITKTKQINKYLSVVEYVGVQTQSEEHNK